MIELVKKEDVEAVRAFAEELSEMQDPEKLAEAQIIGKHGTVLVDFDTGMGVTAEDLAKENPEIYKMFLNSTSLHKMAQDVSFGGLQ